MASPIAVGDKVRVRVYCQLGNQVSINTFYYEMTAEVGGVTDVNLAEFIDPRAGNAFKAIMTQEANYLGVRVDVMAPTPTVYVQSFAETGPGERATDALPPQVAGLIWLKGPLALRTHVGRRFLPFPAEGDNTASGVPAPAYLIFATGVITAMMTQFDVVVGANSGTFTPVHWIRKSNSFVSIAQSGVRKAWSTHRTRNFLRSGDAIPS